MVYIYQYMVTGPSIFTLVYTFLLFTNLDVDETMGTSQALFLDLFGIVYTPPKINTSFGKTTPQQDIQHTHNQIGVFVGSAGALHQPI